MDMISTMHGAPTILLAMYLLTAGQVTGAKNDTDATGDDSVSQPPNQYPPITSVEPAAAVDPAAYDDWPWNSSGITGGWCGVRRTLIDDGIRFNGAYSALLFDNLRGGFDTGFFGSGITQIELTVDTDTAMELDGGLVFLNVAQMMWYNGRFQPTGSFSPTGKVVILSPILL